MRKRTPRKVRPAVSPCLIAVGLNDKHEAGMIAAVQAFRRGYATVDNFLDLCDSRENRWRTAQVLRGEVRP